MPTDTKRKRPVAACQPCYSKKQKCDHQYPCSNCVRRRLPELCNYSFADNDNAQTKKSSTPALGDRSPKRARGSQSPSPANNGDTDGESSPPLPSMDLEHSLPLEINLSSCLGYFEGSKSNLFSLMDKFDLLNTKELEADPAGGVVPGTIMPEIKACLDMFPKRPIINCLVQHFLKECNWQHEMIHPTLFLNTYEKWWKSSPGSNVESLGFGILVLRICAYSAQFVPSKTHSSDMILGVAVDTIRQHCEKLATRLWRLTEQLEGPKSLNTLNHLFFHACYVQNEGSMRDAWYILGSAIRVMQDLGIHLEEPLRSQAPLNDLEKDMRRRAFWNLYIWDRFLSLVLDRPALLPEEHYCSVELPKMRFISRASQNSNAPDVFTERLLQAKLSKLWTSLVPAGKSKPTSYDPSSAEELYENLCRNFVAQLPAPFSLQDPDTQYDQQIPMLGRQRQALRIAVFVILCQLFQPLLHLTPEQVQALPQYKRDLIGSHRNHLVNAAVSLLESVTTLHELMGSSPARFYLLSFFSFEPAMLLGMYVLSTATSAQALIKAREQNDKHHLFRSPPTTPTPDTPGIRKGALDATQCRGHIEKALERLTMLQETSMIARVSARKLREVLAKLDGLQSDNNEDSATTKHDLQKASGRGHVHSVSQPNFGLETATTIHEQSNNGTNWFGVDVLHSQPVSRVSSMSSRPQMSRMHSYASVSSLDSAPVQGHSHGRELSTYRPQHQHSRSHSHAQHPMIIDLPAPQMTWPMNSPPTFSPGRHCISPPMEPPFSGVPFSEYSHDSTLGDSVGSAHSSAHFQFDNEMGAAQWPLYDQVEGEGLGVYVPGFDGQFLEKDYLGENRGLRSDSGVSVSPTQDMFQTQMTETN